MLEKIKIKKIYCSHNNNIWYEAGKSFVTFINIELQEHNIVIEKKFIKNITVCDGCSCCIFIDFLDGQRLFFK